MIDAIIIAIIVIAVGAACRYIYKSKKKGKCIGCSCSGGCSGNCCEDMKK